MTATKAQAVDFSSSGTLSPAISSTLRFWCNEGGFTDNSSMLFKALYLGTDNNVNYLQELLLPTSNFDMFG